MKITEIEALPIAVGPGNPRAVIVVLVRTDDGLTGIGEASLAGRGRAVLGALDHLGELLIGQDPGAIEHWWQAMVRGTFWSPGQVVMSAVAGIDLALWDLKGKRLGVPVYELLGGPTRSRVRIYRHLAGSTIEEQVEDALRWAERGVTALRFCPTHSVDSVSLDLWEPVKAIVATERLVAALRDAVGAEIDLICDAHTMFSPAETIQLGKALEPYRLFFYEDPVRPLDPASLCHVRQKLDLPLATGEQLSHKWEFRPLIEEELVDYLRIDLVHAGGISEGKKILAAAEIHGQRAALHHASSPVNGAACLHLDCSVPNVGIQEWMEIEPLYELFPNAPRAVGGYVERPRGPGLGLDFDEEEARRRPSRDAELPHRRWPDGAVADY